MWRNHNGNGILFSIGDMKARKNQIEVRQNSAEGLKYLSAYSYLYSKAKTLLGTQSILMVPIPLAWSAIVIPNPELRPYMVLYSLAVVLLDVMLLNRRQSKMKEDAARIQEMFDCFLLEIPWRTLQVGAKVDAESLNEYESKYRRKQKDLNHLKDWFVSDVGSIPIEYARLICQRTNLLWDTKLRKRYTVSLRVILWTFFAAVIVFSVQQSMPMDVFLSTVAVVVLPAVVWGIREVSRHSETISRLATIKSHLDHIWNEILKRTMKAQTLEARTSEIQSEIYRLRANNPVIFNWVYKLQRNRTQSHVDSVTRDLISELRSQEVFVEVGRISKRNRRSR